MQLLDHEGRNAAAQPSSAAAHAACLAAIDERLRRAAGDGMPLRVRTAVQLPPPAPAGPGRASLAFLIMAHRRFAHATVARLVRALDAPSHLFLLHIDARAHSAVADWAASEPRVHLLERRPVGWGAASQVEVMLEAVAIALAAAPSLDFVINLSDADVALRTGRELSSFLARHRGTSFVAAKFPARDGMRYGAHATMRTPAWLECRGEGFLILNGTPAALFGEGSSRCCYARSGPILYPDPRAPPLPIGRPPPPQGTSFFHGSQWAVLSAEAASYLLSSARPRALALHLEGTYMADETFLQTALLGSPFARTSTPRGGPALLAHNLRYIDWPHGYGDPAHYWHSVGPAHASGPMVLSPQLLPAVFSSPAAFARKVDLDRPEGVAFLEQWDRWMSYKLALERGGEEAAAADTAAAAADTAAADTAAAAAADPPLAPGQQPLGADLLHANGTLRRLALPPTDRQRDGMSDEAQRAAWPPHATHYGHEDIMALQFEGGAAAPPTQQGQAARSDSQRQATAGGGASAARRVARIEFTDGSSCSCAADCTQRRYLKDCCVDWLHACKAGRL